MTKKIFPLIIIMLIATNSILAQPKKGSFNQDISFKGTQRTISCYVPDNYDKPSLFIGLHGAGDNGIHYAEILIKQYNIQSLLSNTIFIFPDGGEDQARDFYAPEGDEEIIDSVIQWAVTNYQIEVSNIYLQGFSLGGRSALKWGLDNPEKVKGLILNTPAVQSPFDVQNVAGRSLMFNYKNANKMRIAMVHGKEDIGFYNTVSMLADSLVFNDAKLFYLQYPGMQHSLPPLQVEEVLVKYIDSEITKPLMKVHKLLLEPYFTSENLKFKALLHNYSNVDIENFKITLEFQNKEQTFVFNTPIKSYQHLEIELPLDYNNLNLQLGNYDIAALVSEVNDIQLAKNEITNYTQADFNYFSPAKSIPYVGAMNEYKEIIDNWAFKYSGNFISWMQASNLFSSNKTSGLAMLNTILAYDNFGLVESFYSNVFDYSTAIKPELSFDIAYNYSHYTTKYFTNEIDFMDTLQISISNDNGKTFTPIFKQYGEDLRTYKKVFTDIVAFADYFVAPKNDEWKNISIDLANYNVSDKTQFRFDVISGSGGVIVLKNMKFYDGINSIAMDNEINETLIYPNPASNFINLPQNADYEANETIKIFNEAGINVMNSDYQTRLDIGKLPIGNYFISFGNNRGKFTIIR